MGLYANECGVVHDCMGLYMIVRVVHDCVGCS